MKRGSCGIVLAGMALVAGCSTFRANDEEGFVPLFNGKDLSGWEGATDT